MTDSVATLTGNTVTVNYEGDAHAGYGEFVLSNAGPAAISVAAESVWLEVKGERHPLSKITLFDPERSTTLDAADFKVAPGGILRFWVSFLSIAYEPRS